MVRPRGFEPLAYSFGDCRSIQLSYGRTFEKVIMTPVRFPIAVLAAIVLFAAATPAQKAGIPPAEYQARRNALSKQVGAAKGRGEDATALLQEVAGVGDELTARGFG